MTRLCLGGPYDGQHVAPDMIGDRLMLAGEISSDWTDYNLRTVRVNGEDLEVWIREGLHARDVLAGLERHLGVDVDLEWVA